MIMEINYYYYLLLPYFNLVAFGTIPHFCFIMSERKGEKREREHKINFNELYCYFHTDPIPLFFLHFLNKRKSFSFSITSSYYYYIIMEIFLNKIALIFSHYI